MWRVHQELIFPLSIRQFISIKDKGKIGTVLRNWPAIKEARISVVTDGKSIPARPNSVELNDPYRVPHPWSGRPWFEWNAHRDR